MFKRFPHKKDEALALDIPYVEVFPIPPVSAPDAQKVEGEVAVLSDLTTAIRTADHTLADWLRVDQGLAKLPGALVEASRLDADGFVAAVRAALPKREAFGPLRLARIRDAFTEVAEPARAARTAALGHEHTLSALVNRAYGLSDEEVALMWRTAPPRMPVPPPAA